MYKSRENDYQRRYDDSEPQSSYGYESSRPHYQEDRYNNNDDDFYGQIMRNASRNKPYRSEPKQDYDTFEKSYDEPVRPSRAEATGRMPRIEEDPYTRISYSNERPSYTGNTGSYQEPYKEPEYTQPVRAYERTSQYMTGQFKEPVDDYSKTGNYQRESYRETPSRRARMQEENYHSRESMQDPFAAEQTSSLRRRRVMEESTSSYSGFPEMEEAERKGPMTLSEEYETKQKKKKTKQKSNKKKAVKTAVKAPVDTSMYGKFLKNNLLILLIALINMVAVSLIITSVLYTQFLKNYIIQPSLTDDMIKTCLMLAPLFAYQVAGLHCGYALLKDKIEHTKTGVKILLSPLLFIAFEVTGFFCEIPYLIYCAIKMQDEDE